MIHNLLIAVHAFPMHMLTLLSVEDIATKVCELVIRWDIATKTIFYFKI